MEDITDVSQAHYSRIKPPCNRGRSHLRRLSHGTAPDGDLPVAEIVIYWYALLDNYIS